MTKARAHLVVSGRVQGVFYRAYARDRAESLQLGGWIKNRPDGGVEAVVEGEAENVDVFINWCRQGPPSARVEHVELDRQEYSGEFAGFAVRY
jgi:acylphosphatase